MRGSRLSFERRFAVLALRQGLNSERADTPSADKGGTFGREVGIITR